MRQSILQKHLIWILYITYFYAGFAEAAPDLIITDIWPDGNRIHYQVQNTGDKDCLWPHAATLLIDDEYRSKDIILETLKPGQRLNSSFDKYDFACAGIEQIIKVIADGDGQISGADETDNIRKETWKCDLTVPEITEGPAITEIQQDKCKVIWKTDKDADSVVMYSNKTGKFSAVSDTVYTRDHEIYLDGLTAAATYRCKVRSTDIFGNTVESKLLYFTTVSPKDIQSPSVSPPKRKKTDQPLFPLEFNIQAQDDIYLDRAVFSFNGRHFMTDYDPPFCCYVMPEDLDLSYNSFFGLEHSIMAEVFDKSDNLTAD